MTEEAPAPRGEILEDLSELLLRQVHPMFLHAGRLTSQAFRPGGNDGGLLSVSRRTLNTPKGSWEFHTQDKGLRSVGVWGVTVQECLAEGLRCHADPEAGPPPDPSHALVDFRGLSRGEFEARAKRLAVVAALRGCLFTPAPGL